MIQPFGKPDPTKAPVDPDPQTVTAHCKKLQANVHLAN